MNDRQPLFRRGEIVAFFCIDKMLILFKYCADVENCESFWFYIYIYIYIYDNDEFEFKFDLLEK